MGLSPIDTRDHALIQIVDAALAEAGRRSGPWLACRPGCCECCLGVFAISQLDARRLQAGLRELDRHDPPRAERVRARAREAVARLSPEFPGDPSTGLLAEGEAAEARFAGFAEDEPCPALDPAAKTCDLYEARPMTCRTFGPAVRGSGGAIGACELCYQGASDEQIAACAVDIDPEGSEADLIADCEGIAGDKGPTIVASCLAT